MVSSEIIHTSNFTYDEFSDLCVGVWSTEITVEGTFRSYVDQFIAIVDERPFSSDEPIPSAIMSSMKKGIREGCFF